MKIIFFLVIALATVAFCGETEFIATCLQAHNVERAALGISGLRWSDDLAESALRWAKQLARKNTLKHSDDREHIGENIARTKSKENSVEVLLGMWTDEKRYYVHKPYPKCSRSGDKGDVGHYTQIIWQDTTEVGCGLANGFGRDYLVCQYDPSGNRRNKLAYDETRVHEPTEIEETDVIRTEETKIITQEPGKPSHMVITQIKTEETDIKSEPVVSSPVVNSPVVSSPVVSSPVASSPVVSSPEASSDPFIKQCLEDHNVERAPLGIPDLTWNEELAATALSWAKQLANKGSLSHSKGRNHIGENVSYTSTKENSLGRLIEMWRDEKKYYVHRPYPDCSSTGDTGDVGHYTQMIWKDTTELGCGLATKNKKDFLVCQYKTSGNRRGKYAY